MKIKVRIFLPVAILMPALSPTVAEGNVVKYLKRRRKY